MFQKKNFTTSLYSYQYSSIVDLPVPYRYGVPGTSDDDGVQVPTWYSYVLTVLTTVPYRVVSTSTSITYEFALFIDE